MNTSIDFWERLESVPIKTQPVSLKAFASNGITADVLRLDKIDPVISGNKWFKLKYHFAEARQRDCETVVTLGGSWSNHIIATAAAAQAAGLTAHGVIRGEKAANLSLTLTMAKQLGMQLKFVSRETFAKLTHDHSELFTQYPGAYVIPAGGSGDAGVRGSREILQRTTPVKYSHVACSIGTATMFTGLIEALSPHQTVIGIPALKGFYQLPGAYRDRLNRTVGHGNWKIFGDYHLGGYARKTAALIDFMNHLFDETAIETDFVYTAKLFWACVDLAQKQLIPSGANLLIIHSGGLQGNQSLPPGLLHF